MNEIIKLTAQTIGGEPQQTVNARELHARLEVKTEFKDWIARRIKDFDFQEGIDFCSFLSESTGGRPAQDAVLTIDMAKELCMIQRNEKGKQARQYFLQIEKDWNSPEKVMARALQIAGDKLKRLENKVEADAPKVLFADAVSASKTSILVGELAKLLKQNGVDIGQHRLFRWMRENGYLIRRNGTDFNMPTQKSMDLGLFTVKETAITHSDGTVTVSKTTKVTGKGQQYFIQKFLGEEGARI